MPIIKYNKNKIYNPDDFKHSVRRACKQNIKNNYISVSLQSQALRLLLSLPFIKETIMFAVKQGTKLIRAETELRYKLLTKEK